MNTILTKDDQAKIKKARRNKCSGPIYSEDGLRLLKVLGNPEYLEVEECFGLCDNWKEIALPETLRQIRAGAFACCKALEEIKIPSHLNIIDMSAFRSSGLKSLNIVISDDCECCIYDKAFASCKHLESVYLNKNVKIVERMAFAGCTSLKTIEFEQPSLTGSIGEINATMLIGCTSLEKIIVPKNKYNHYPDFNIQGYESDQFETRDFNSLVTPKE